MIQKTKTEEEILKEIRGLEQLSPAEAWEKIRDWAKKLKKEDKYYHNCKKLLHKGKKVI